MSRSAYRGTRSTTSIVVKWQEYLQAEGKRQGEPAGMNFKWVINVANADPARQAANIEDLINQGVNLIMARARRRRGDRRLNPRGKAGRHSVHDLDRQSATTKPTAHVGGDSYDQGKTTAEAFVALLKEQGRAGQVHRAAGRSHRHQCGQPLQSVACRSPTGRA